MDASTSTRPPDQSAWSAARLTDQASVAVHLARSLTAPDGPGANVAHLVAGLAGEPEGMAGAALRRSFGEVAPRIAVHPALAARALPSLATAYIALPVVDRPAWTLELLHAALRVGGADLAHLLAECGVDVNSDLAADDLAHRMPDPDGLGEATAAPETFGRMSLLDRGFSRDADLAVSRCRARGGDSTDLLAWLDADETTRNALSSAPPVPLEDVVARAGLSDLGVQRSDLVTAITHLSLRRALGS